MSAKNGVVFLPDTPEVRYKMQQLARHQTIHKMLNDILADMMVCDLEGWNKMEYINMLYDTLGHFKAGKE